ncbi:MAG: hypothetical protein U0270_04290 [Labilithrix sp.]
MKKSPPSSRKPPVTKYFFVSPEKEHADTTALSKQISESEWFVQKNRERGRRARDGSLVIVNCSPDYSSKVSMVLSHALSPQNNDIPLPLYHLQMPYPNSTAADLKECKASSFELFMKLSLLNEPKIIFVDAGVLRGVNFTVLRADAVRAFPEKDVAFACLYVQRNSVFKPDFFVEEFDFETQGGLMFHWENPKNPLWNY